MHVGDDAYHGGIGQSFKHVKAGFQKRHIAAKAIDDRSFHHGLLFGFKQLDGAIEAGEYAAAVDIAHQDDGCARHGRHAAVHEIVLLQVDFSRTAGALKHDDVVLSSQSIVCLLDDGAQLVFERVIVARGHIAAHLAKHDNLAAGIVCGLEQHRVHQDGRLDAGSFRLHDLRTAHFKPFSGNVAVQCHVLAFERRNFVTVLRKDAA